jgi:hypothetical protein
MGKKRVPLYERLPEIYRIKDEELAEAKAKRQGKPVESVQGELKSYLALVEDIFGAIHENIETLYNDLFIETCHPWVIPYIGDLLGASHLAGDPWTLRADVADTIALRRSKGTLAAIEKLTHDLTGWGVHCVELIKNIAWHQHLNHQRPDVGDPQLSRPSEPYGRKTVTRFTPVRGGFCTVRDPATLTLLHPPFHPFDPFAHMADLKPAASGALRHNTPNLAVFLWRLPVHRVQLSQPFYRGRKSTNTQVAGEATHLVRFDVHPLGRPIRLFNSYAFDPVKGEPITEVDEVPGPIPAARLDQQAEDGHPEKYFSISIYAPGKLAAVSDAGLQLHLPESRFEGEEWHEGKTDRWIVAGANLCAWEKGVQSPIRDRDVLIDPELGRILVGVGTTESNTGEADARALRERMLVTYTYATAGSIGANPGSRSAAPAQWMDKEVVRKEVDLRTQNSPTLEDVLKEVQTSTDPVVIEIMDSRVHVLDLKQVDSGPNEAGGPNLRLNSLLSIRAADGQRPVILLKRPLRFRAADVREAAGVEVHLDGLYISRDESLPAKEPLIARAVVNSLEITDCTLDPGGYRQLGAGSGEQRAPIATSISLKEPYGLTTADDEKEFAETPHVSLRSVVTGPVLMDTGYTLEITDSIIDAAGGAANDPKARFCISSATDPKRGWGPPSEVYGVTFLGPVRVESICGRGGIWTGTLEVHNNQTGCIRYSYFSGAGDRLPQILGCVKGSDGVRLQFVSKVFEESAYGQLHHTSAYEMLEQGPGSDAMGAFGFEHEAHKWRNIQIRFREFMPVGVRPLLIPVT